MARLMLSSRGLRKMSVWCKSLAMDTISPQKRLLSAVVERAFQDVFARVGDEPKRKAFASVVEYQKRHSHWRTRKFNRDDALDFVLGPRIFTFTDILGMNRDFVRDRVKRAIPNSPHSLPSIPKPKLPG